MTAPPADDSDAFVAAFLRQRLADQGAGVARGLDDYCRLFPGREALIRQAWSDSEPCTAAADEPQPHGSTIGPYRLQRRLGRGGQGEVWLGEDPRLGRRVAIKLLRGVAFATADGLARFRREAEVASQLDHPGICPVYDVGFASGVPYLVMRYLEGQPLAEALPGLVPHPGPQLGHQLRRVATIVERLATALHAAHEAGVLHRDVKPQNVMLTAGDVPVLLDFGLARLVGDDTLFTRTGDRFGTPAYLAPEQLAEPPAPCDRSVDVYGVGIVLYECLTGRRPFAAPTLDSLYRRILDGSAPTAEQGNAAVPRDLAVIAATAMERDPARRYATAQALGDDLRRWLARKPILARPTGPLLRLRRWVQRSPALASALLGLIVSLVAGLLVSLSLWRTATQEERHATHLLGEWERLADRRRLEELVREADRELWPAVPDKLPAMDAWLQRAQPLVQRLGAHERALAELTAELAAEGDGREGQAELLWRRHQLEELVRELAAFAADDRFATTVASMRHRRRHAEELAQRTLVEPAAAWAAAIVRIDRQPLYRGLELIPQLGVVPIGADPQSGLEEFADPQTGEVPARDADGLLRRSEATAVVFVLLPAGAFVMGAQKTDPAGPNYDPEAWIVEAPPHRVELSAFLLSKYELTQAQWQAVMGDNPSRSQRGRVVRGVAIDALHPVENVSWQRCHTLAVHCGWVLPTEAQWEYGCRAGTTTPWSTGEHWDSLVGSANFADAGSQKEYPVDWPYHADTDDGHSVHAPVGSYLPNRFGLHDMHGNVREWCQDAMLRYDSPVLPETGERLPRADQAPLPGDPAALRANRGGSCVTMAAGMRSARRSEDQIGMQYTTLGVRPARRLMR